MSRLSTLAALLLVALWLPATLHCQLESAGLDNFFSCADHANSTTHAAGNDCKDSVCQTVESGAITVSHSLLTVAPPTFSACLCHLCLLIAEPAEACLLAPAPEPTPPWQPARHFARRTALPARAPSLLLT